MTFHPVYASKQGRALVFAAEMMSSCFDKVARAIRYHGKYCTLMLLNSDMEKYCTPSMCIA